MKTPRRFRLPSLPVLTVVCGLLAACNPSSILPKTADEAGMTSARVAVAMGVSGLSALPENVDELEVEVVDVLLHRASDDSWVLLANESTTLDLTHGPGSVHLTGIPIGTGLYDRVEIVLGDVRVHDALGWHDAKVAKPEILVDVRNGIEFDTAVDLDLDVSSALKGSAGSWKLTPKFRIEISEM